MIEAARALFVESGQENTTVDAIARRAGVAKGTVYLYFPSKSHIAQAIEEQFNARVLTRVQAAAREAVAAGHPPAVAWCGALIEAYLDELDTHDMLFTGRPQTRDAVDPLLDDLTALLAAQGHPDPERVAAFLLGGTTLLADRAIATDSRIDAGELTHVLVALDETVGVTRTQNTEPSR
ncbi:TetR/AcrR family transcriptional regulator [Leifsonia sp. ZF2019]|uniref:TetR/AcrR family transcriptional regulator n=1 Tax=Leifsonia sp. ZF2019 TaxID=2781978 RepID=UPI001CBF8CD1|nr:helix-turn-helix domain-containing protein [Leifsonia sp. ZF2019]